MKKKIKRLLAFGLAVTFAFQPICVRANEFDNSRILLEKKTTKVGTSFLGTETRKTSNIYQITNTTPAKKASNPSNHLFVDSYIALSNFNSEEIIENGTCGENAYYYINAKGILTIYGTGKINGYPLYGSQGTQPWYNQRENITSVVIEDGITEIGFYVFYDCLELTDISMPKSLKIIDAGAFDNCTKLKNIYMDEGNPYYSVQDGVLYDIEKQTLIKYFEGKNDTTFTIPNGITSIGYKAFKDCNKLENIIIPDSVISITNSAFDGTIYEGKIGSCGKTIIWKLSDEGTLTIHGKGEINGYPLYGSQGTQPWYNQRENITSVVIEDGITEIGFYVFYDCLELTDISMPKSLKIIDAGAFDNCTKLKNIYMDKGNPYYSVQDGVLYDIEKQTLIRYFEGKNDTTFTIPNDITSIGYKAFKNCDKLENIIIPDSVISIANSAFDGTIYEGKIGSCGKTIIWKLNNEGTLTIHGKGEINGYPLYGSQGTQPWYNQRENITSVVIDDGITEIGFYVFYDCIKLKSILISKSIKRIDSSAFKGCNDFIIYGYENSYAQTYATENNIIFSVLADDKEASEFTIGRDNNLFGNSPESFFLNTTKDYRINAISYRSALYKNQSDNYCNLLLQKQFENWGGSCYGISASVMYAYNKGYDITKYIAEDSKDYPYYASVDWPVFNSATKDMIQVFQLSQFRSDVTYTDTTNNSFIYKTFGIGSDIKTLLKGIVNEAEKSNYLKPFLLGVTYKGAGHALVVCGSEGKVNGYYKIAICDPNCQFEYRYLMISESYSDFHMEDKDGLTIYSGKIDSDNFKELKYVTYEDAYSGAASKKSDSCELIVNVNSSFYMTTDAGTYLSYDGEEFTGTAKVHNVSTAIKSSNGDESSSWIIELSGINKVNFSNMSSTMEVDCLFDSDEYANVIGNNLTTVSFEDNKGVSIEGTDAAYTLSISAKDDNNTLIQASGEVTDSITYEYDGADIKVNGTENISVKKITDEGIEALDEATDPAVIADGKNDISITGIALNKNSLSMNIGETYNLVATISPSTATGYMLNWSSSNTNVATVFGSGEIEAIAAGTTTITVDVNGIKATCIVTVTGRDTDNGNTSGNLDNGVSDNRNENDNPNTSLNTVKIGDTVSKGKVTYKIINIKKKTVEYVKTRTSSAKVSIPATVKLNGISYKVTKLSDNAFRNNTRLKTVTIGNNVATIGKNAFSGCKALKSITISSKVTKIGVNAFKGCRKLKTIIVKSTKLTKSGLKNALKGSFVTTIKLTGSAKKKYKKYVKYFAKANCGRKVQIKK